MAVEHNPWEKETVETLLIQYLKTTQKRPFLGIVHRIDRVTSGVLLLAKKKSALRHLNVQFQERRTMKTYLAVVERGKISAEGTLVHWLEKDRPGKRAIIHEAEVSNSRLAHLTYEVLSVEGDLALLRIQPQTGRFHQIRAQLGYCGHPVVGDKKYGSTRPTADRQIALHAYALIFQDPNSGKKQLFKATLPDAPWWSPFRTFIEQGRL